MSEAQTLIESEYNLVGLILVNEFRDQEIPLAFHQFSSESVDAHNFPIPLMLRQIMIVLT